MGADPPAKNCKEIEMALLSAASILGDPAAQALVFVLKDRYGIRLGGPPCSSREEIEAALVDISGATAEILLVKTRAYLGK